jgi:hypothetical protein
MTGLLQEDPFLPGFKKSPFYVKLLAEMDLLSKSDEEDTISLDGDLSDNASVFSSEGCISLDASDLPEKLNPSEVKIYDANGIPATGTGSRPVSPSLIPFNMKSSKFGEDDSVLRVAITGTSKCQFFQNPFKNWLIIIVFRKCRNNQRRAKIVCCLHSHC